MNLTIPRISGDTLTIPVEHGQQLYVVGPNGAGKSALFQYWVSSMRVPTFKRIVAHRQTWLTSGSPDFSTQSRKQFERIRMSLDSQEDARWMEQRSIERQSALLFDLLAKDNSRNRAIGQYIDNNNPEEATAFAAKSTSPFRQLNDLLDLGTLKISLKNSDGEEILAQHKDNHLSYSMAQMSDGERAATILAATVLVADPGTIFLIDEPERHLHRSIIEPFLSALFGQRLDCAFVISTHEITLPMANPTARIIMLRSCGWQDNKPVSWDTELLESGEHLPEDLKRDILGSRRRILFVEGTANSLDLPLYSALFPELSVIPKGSCDEVIRAVKGLRSSQGHHRVEAFGLIDRDDRAQDEIEELAKGNVFALDVCSAEALYYCWYAIEAIGRRQEESLDYEPNTLINKATQSGLKALNKKCLPEKMAAMQCERRVRNQIEALAPDWRKIQKSGEEIQLPPAIKSPYTGELSQFRKLANANDMDELIARYPLKKSDVFDKIAQALECGNKENYQRMVIARIRKDKDLSSKLRLRIKPLSDLLDTRITHDT